MGFFTSGLFWFIEGVLATFFFLGFRAWAQDRGLVMTWWKWVLFFLWILLAGFTIAFVGTSIGEKRVTAAFRGGLILGIITVVSGWGLWRLIHRGRPEQ